MRPWQAYAFLGGTIALAACNQQPAANQAQAPAIKVRGSEQEQLHKLTAHEPRDCAQARDLRRRLHLQPRDRRRLRRPLSRIWTCGKRAAPTASKPATGRSSPAPTAAPRSATARMSMRPGFPNARSSTAQRTRPRRRSEARRSARVALAGFLIVARRRPFLDGDAIALLDFLAPTAVGLGHAIGLGNALAVANLIVPAPGSLPVLGQRGSRKPPTTTATAIPPPNTSAFLLTLIITRLLYRPDTANDVNAV